MPQLAILLGLLALPLVEIGVFIAVGSEIGVAWTLALVVLSGVAGVLLVRRQSFSTLQAAQAEARSGRVPAREIVHGAMIVSAGLLLILPGFVTDAFGLLLLIPPVRDVLWRRLRSRVVVRSSYGRAHQPYGRSGPTVVDLSQGEFERREGDPDSPWHEIEDERDGRDDRRRP
ncbi:FxsA family protein [Aureimonas populi]|uniref:FxsA family protein n=1 Tax=Aureimonas populi TaxID=1701758 RepID=A0ABW5CS43_9HYPH|nr:FxsA family protein [Aureimonas populi]